MEMVKSEMEGRVGLLRWAAQQTESLGLRLVHQETWEAKLLRQIENISGILTATAYIIMNILVQ